MVSSNCNFHTNLTWLPKSKTVKLAQSFVDRDSVTVNERSFDFHFRENDVASMVLTVLSGLSAWR